MATLIRTDKNGTKYYVEHKCPKCDGQGYIPGYEFIEGGICFLCGGSGIHTTHWKEYTEEYAKKLSDKRLERARAKSAELNKEWLEKNGFSANGKVWIVLGNTYNIKDELKAAGARFNSQLGWHFDHNQDVFESFEVDVDILAHKMIDYRYDWIEDIFEVVKQLKDDHAPKSASEYVGEIGAKLEIEVKYEGCFTYRTHFTYSGENHFVYRFRDLSGNTIIWNSSSYQELEDDKNYKIKGTVKKHDEYKNDKQTVLTRCKVEAI